ncbi:hypothetical protein VFPBJ_02625 [Purpureocillium lilacinum]|uniref:Uncharacterized protein n=1 Tax=Purpureocillium lilacinum TaxID=33203 RepID=A0A179H2E6_PURLI|nr:hypothetical protein VFPBJ_02625 [Purpureocillium lilacinum]
MTGTTPWLTNFSRQSKISGNIALVCRFRGPFLGWHLTPHLTDVSGIVDDRILSLVRCPLPTVAKGSRYSSQDPGPIRRGR